jgi:hypothetical protein
MFVFAMIVIIVLFLTFLLVTPTGQEFIRRISSGQWFTIGATTDDQSLNVIVSAHSPESTDTDPPVENTNEPEPASTRSLVNMPEEIVKEPEVFLIQDNVYEYSDAEPLCRAYGARLANMSDMYDAWRKGANWCSYGWVHGQKIVFPTQKESWLKLQESNDKSVRNKCGLPGLNGGLMKDSSARYGVHCFGVKPPTWRNYKANTMAKQNLTAREQEMHSRARYFKERLNEYTIAPFEKTKWSVQYKTGYDTSSN